MAATEHRQPSLLLPLILCLAPAVVLFAFLVWTSIPVPHSDDYEGFLGFMNQWVLLPPHFADKLRFFMAAQHNEYKVFFANAVLLLQFSVLHHISIQVLCMVGNVFVLLLGLLLWFMFPATAGDLRQRLLLFAPVCFLLYQLQYFEALNWAMPGLQNLTVPPVVFACCLLLWRPGTRAFVAALGMMMLAVACSGNGMLLLPIGLLVLALQRHYLRMVPWLGAAAVCLAAYSYHYNKIAGNQHQSIFISLLHMRPQFVFLFLGSAGMAVPVAFLLGVALPVTLGVAMRGGFHRRNPAVMTCALFILITAVGVAGIRSGLTVDASLTPRYKIYSDLMLIFVWFAIVDRYFSPTSTLPLLWRKRLRNAALIGSVCFCLVMDAWGGRIVLLHNAAWIRGMARFEQNRDTVNGDGPEIRAFGLAHDEEHAVAARAILRRSVELGTYRLPPYPASLAH